MNRKNILGLVLILVIFTSGPIYYPLAVLTSTINTVATAETIELDPLLNRTSTINQPASDYSDNLTYIEIDANINDGGSPLFVTFTSKVTNSHLKGGVLVYKWDFNGDGRTDYSNLETGDTTHVYLVNKETEFDATLTVEYRNGDSQKDTILISVSPVNPDEWLEIKNLGYTKFGLNSNGNITVFDEKDWIHINLYNKDKKLISPTLEQIDDVKTKLSYQIAEETIELIIEYGLSGRAKFSFTGYDSKGQIKVLSDLAIKTKDNIHSKGRLNVKTKLNEDNIKKNQSTDAGNADPWTDQGVVPYGEYFKNLDSFVATETGYLSIVQTDFSIPGRGLDLIINRVYAEPKSFEGITPAGLFDYSHIEYPWAPMGNAWQLGFPWFEYNASGITYIRLENGQRYKFDEAASNGTIYRSGDYFTLAKHPTNSNFTLTRPSGTRYDFDSEYKLLSITDTNKLNTITFTYNLESKISIITDTIGREYHFTYGEHGQVSKIQVGDRSVRYIYSLGHDTGYRLIKVTDPEGRSTDYCYRNDYLVHRIEYSTGGFKEFDYEQSIQGNYIKYRVSKVYSFHDPTVNPTITNFTYTGNFYGVTETLLETYCGDELTKTTKMEFSPESSKQTVWNGTQTDSRIYSDSKTLTDERRRELIEHFPGDSTTNVSMVNRYDNWGNRVFSRDFEGYDTYLSFYNTDSSGMFVDSDGTQIDYYSDSFYSPTISTNIRTLKSGIAKTQNSMTGQIQESYNDYSLTGDLVESKSLLNDSWVKTELSHDLYGNLVKTNNSIGNVDYYEYNTSNHAYLINSHELLTGTTDRNITIQHQYDYWTGQLLTVTDPRGNATQYTYDKLGRVTQVTYPQIDSYAASQSVSYADEENYVSVFDENNVKTVNHYDELGRLNCVERFNESISYSNETYQYGPHGLVETFTDTLGTTYSYLYDGRGALIKTINPDNSTNRQVHDYTNNSMKSYDEEDRLTEYFYDNLGQLIKVKEYYDATQYYLTEYEYDNVGSLISVTDALSRRTEYIYDQLNRLTFVVDPDGNGETYEYDTAGNLLRHYDRNATLTEFTYDSLDRLVDETYSWTNKTFKATQNGWLDGWDYRKEIIITGSEAGTQTDYQVRVTCYYGDGIDDGEYVYLNEISQTDFGDLRFTSADGESVLNYWMGEKTDSSQVRMWVEIPQISASPTETSFYLYYGNAAADSISNGTATFLEFEDFEEYSNGAQLDLGKFIDDEIERTVQVSNSDSFTGSNSLYFYDTSSSYNNDFHWNVDDRTTGGYRVHFAFTETGYADRKFRPLKLYTSNGLTVRIQYEVGTLYTYDGSSWNTIQNIGSDWDACEFCFVLGTSGDVLDVRVEDDWMLNQETEAVFGSLYYIELMMSMNSQKAQGYIDSFFLGKYCDPEPLITSVGAQTIEPKTNIEKITLDSVLYSYDDNNNLKQTEYDDTIIHYEYDARNRVIRELFNVSGTVNEVNYQYDNTSRVISMVYPDDSEVVYGYDSLNRLSSVGNYASIKYTLLDNIDTITYGNDVTTSYAYDNRSRPTGISVFNGETPLLELDYTYDYTGSVTSIYDGTTLEIYDYDLLDRLVFSNGSWGLRYYDYDGVSNRITLDTKGGANNVSYSYNSMDQLVTATDMGFDWDSNGNMLDRNDGSNKWNYTYDPLNRLKTVTKDEWLSSVYTYDAGGRRVRSWLNDTIDVTIDYLYSGLNIIDEVSSGVHERHIYAGGMHIASNTTGTVEYYHVDHLGSTRLKTNSAGTEIYDSNYEPFGPGEGETGTEDYRYTGKREDPSGLYYFGARYYDPLTGRFTTRDTFHGFRSNPESLNSYVYCQNNPLKYVDPTGHISTDYIDASVMVMAAIYYAYMAAPAIESLFISLQGVTAAIPMSPSPDTSVSDGIEQYREQTISNYGVYQDTADSSVITEQTKFNRITFNSGNNEEKINEGQQAKHDTYHANYKLEKSRGRPRSPVFDPNTQNLLNNGMNNGVLKTGTPPTPGSSEYVNFKEWIGLAVPPGGGQSIFTMWGKIHYGSRGHHIVPGPPIP